MKTIWPTSKFKGDSPFPPVWKAFSDGLLHLTDHVNPELLLAAYSNGIFPWPSDNRFIPWFSPPERAVLFFDKMRIPHGFKRSLPKLSFGFSVNQRFEEVILRCASARGPGRHATWITPKMLKAYNEFHDQGFAWSFETLHPDGSLAGGLYGIRIGRYFCGESMFHAVPEASKFALVKTVEFLKSQGSTWLDAQTPTPLLLGFGAQTVSREEFMEMLREAAE